MITMEDRVTIKNLAKKGKGKREIAKLFSVILHFLPFKKLFIYPVEIISIVSLFFLDWTWVINIGSMLFALFFGNIARQHYSMIVEKRAFRSEAFFCYLLKEGYIFVRDNKTGKGF